MAITHLSGPLEVANGIIVDAGGLVVAAGGITVGATTIGNYVDTTISSAQLLALFTTPIAVIPALGAGLAAIPTAMTLSLSAGTAYTIGSAGLLKVNYTDASGVEVMPRVTVAGFLDQSTAQLRNLNGAAGAAIGSAGSFVPATNAAVVISQLTANVTAGTGVLKIRTFYRVISAL